MWSSSFYDINKVESDAELQKVVAQREQEAPYKLSLVQVLPNVLMNGIIGELCSLILFCKPLVFLAISRHSWLPFPCYLLSTLESWLCRAVGGYFK
jgi:hypothetical protein